jgi:hypothetical protein
MTVFSNQCQYRRIDLASMPEERTIKGRFSIERQCHCRFCREEREGRPTCHHLRPVCQGKLVSKPALTILPLIPAPSKRPKTVRRNNVTTSWSRGESRSAEIPSST